jgi:hypothetical protein
LHGIKDVYATLRNDTARVAFVSVDAVRDQDMFVLDGGEADAQDVELGDPPSSLVDEGAGLALVRSQLGLVMDVQVALRSAYTFWRQVLVDGAHKPFLHWLGLVFNIQLGVRAEVPVDASGAVGTPTVHIPFSKSAQVARQQGLGVGAVVRLLGGDAVPPQVMFAEVPKAMMDAALNLHKKHSIPVSAKGGDGAPKLVPVADVLRQQTRACGGSTTASVQSFAVGGPKFRNWLFRARQYAGGTPLTKPTVVDLLAVALMGVPSSKFQGSPASLRRFMQLVYDVGQSNPIAKERAQLAAVLPKHVRSGCDVPAQAAGPSQATAGPSQATASASQATASASQATAGPSQAAAGPSQVAAGPSQAALGGPSQAAAGPSQAAAGGPSQAAAGGPSQAAAGPSQATASPSQATAGGPSQAALGGPSQATRHASQAKDPSQAQDPSQAPPETSSPQQIAQTLTNAVLSVEELDSRDLGRAVEDAINTLSSSSQGGVVRVSDSAKEAAKEFIRRRTPSTLEFAADKGPVPHTPPLSVAAIKAVTHEAEQWLHLKGLGQDDAQNRRRYDDPTYKHFADGPYGPYGPYGPGPYGPYGSYPPFPGHPYGPMYYGHPHGAPPMPYMPVPFPPYSSQPTPPPQPHAPSLHQTVTIHVSPDGTVGQKSVQRKEPTPISPSVQQPLTIQALEAVEADKDTDLLAYYAIVAWDVVRVLGKDAELTTIAQQLYDATANYLEDKNSTALRQGCNNFMRAFHAFIATKTSTNRGYGAFSTIQSPAQAPVDPMVTHAAQLLQWRLSVMLVR